MSQSPVHHAVALHDGGSQDFAAGDARVAGGRAATLMRLRTPLSAARHDRRQQRWAAMGEQLAVHPLPLREQVCVLPPVPVTELLHQNCCVRTFVLSHFKDAEVGYTLLCILQNTMAESHNSASGHVTAIIVRLLHTVCSKVVYCAEAGGCSSTRAAALPGGHS